MLGVLGVLLVTSGGHPGVSRVIVFNPEALSLGAGKTQIDDAHFGILRGSAHKNIVALQVVVDDTFVVDLQQFLPNLETEFQEIISSVLPGWRWDRRGRWTIYRL